MRNRVFLRWRATSNCCVQYSSAYRLYRCHLFLGTTVRAPSELQGTEILPACPLKHSKHLYTHRFRATHCSSVHGGEKRSEFVLKLKYFPRGGTLLVQSLDLGWECCIVHQQHGKSKNAVLLLAACTARRRAGPSQRYAEALPDSKLRQ